MMFGLGSFNLINEFERVSNEPNAEQLDSVRALLKVSCCTWLFLMKSQTELFSVFQKFFVEICNQFHTSICILRSDNALEYLFASFFSFLSSHGILH